MMLSLERRKKKVSFLTILSVLSYCACFQERQQYKVRCSLFRANTLKDTLPHVYKVSLARIL